MNHSQPWTLQILPCLPKKNVKLSIFSQTIRRKRKVQIPVSRPGDRETMSEHEEEDSDEDDGYEHHTGGGRSAYEGASGGTGTGRRHDRERSSSNRRDNSASRERSISPRSDRRSQASSAPPRPAKVTLVKSRKNEGGQHNVQESNPPNLFNDVCTYQTKNLVFLYFTAMVHLMRSFNMTLLCSISRVWTSVGQPHICQGHLPRKPCCQRWEHPGGRCCT